MMKHADAKGLLGLLVVLCVFGAAPPASAHPHVFVSVRSSIVFGADRKIIALRHDWTFDEMYTAFAITGFGKDSQTPSAADLRAIAEQNMQDLAPYKYFTVLESGGETAHFATPVEDSADLIKTKDDYSLELHFTLPLKPPMTARANLTLQVYDPSYFVSFTFAPTRGVSFVGDGGRCATNLTEPKPLSASERASLTESFFTNLPPGANFGLKLAQTVVISCH